MPAHVYQVILWLYFFYSIFSRVFVLISLKRWNLFLPNWKTKKFFFVQVVQVVLMSFCCSNKNEINSWIGLCFFGHAFTYIERRIMSHSPIKAKGKWKDTKELQIPDWIWKKDYHSFVYSSNDKSKLILSKNKTINDQKKPKLLLKSWSTNRIS